MLPSLTSFKKSVLYLYFVTDIVSDSKKPDLGDYKDIYISLITLGGILATALIGSVTNIVLAKIKSSNQNKEKSDHGSNTPSEEERRSSDLSNAERSRRESPSHKSQNGRKHRTQERKKSLCTHGLDFPQERQSVCSEKRRKGRRSQYDDTASNRSNDGNRKTMPTQLAVSGVTKYTPANSSISSEDQLSDGKSMVVINKETRMDGSSGEKPPARNRQLQPQYDTEVSDENISASDVTTIIKVETQETETNLA